MSDEGINFDMSDSKFVDGYDTGMEEYDDYNFFVDDWECYQWTPIGDDDDVTIE